MSAGTAAAVSGLLLVLLFLQGACGSNLTASCSSFSHSIYPLYDPALYQGCSSGAHGCVSTLHSCRAALVEGAPTCKQYTENCIYAYIRCVNSYLASEEGKLSGSPAANCSVGARARTIMVGIWAGMKYNGSALYFSCRATMCSQYNWTAMEHFCPTAEQRYSTYVRAIDSVCSISGSTRSSSSSVTKTKSAPNTESVDATQSESMSMSPPETPTRKRTKTPAVSETQSVSISESDRTFSVDVTETGSVPSPTITGPSITMSSTSSVDRTDVSAAPAVVGDSALLEAGPGAQIHLVAQGNSFDFTLTTGIPSVGQRVFQCLVLTTSGDPLDVAQFRQLLWKPDYLIPVNTSTIQLNFPSVKELNLRRDVRVVIRFTRTCFRVRVLVPENVTAEFILRHNPVKLAAVPEAVKTASESSAFVASGVSGLSSMSSAAAVQAGRLNALLGVQLCDFYYGEPLPWSSHPLQFAIGNAPTRYYLGATVGNFAIVLVFFMIHFGVVHFSAENRRRSLAMAAAKMNFPSISFIPLLLLVQESVTSGVIVLIHGGADDIVGKVVAPIVLLLWVGSIVAGVTRVTVFFSSRYELLPAIRKAEKALADARQAKKKQLKKARKQRVKTGKATNVDDEDVDDDLIDEEKAILLATEAEMDAVADARRRHRITIFFQGDGGWVDRVGSAKSVPNSRKKLHRDPAKGTTKMYSALFDTYRPTREWFFSVEAFVILAMAVLVAIRPSDFDCEIIYICLVVLFGLYLTAVLVLRPYVCLYHAIFYVLVAMAQLLAAVFILVGKRNEDAALIEGASVLSVIGMFLCLAKAALDLGIMGINYCRKKRAVQPDEEDLLSDSSDSSHADNPKKPAEAESASKPENPVAPQHNTSAVLSAPLLWGDDEDRMTQAARESTARHGTPPSSIAMGKGDESNQGREMQEMIQLMKLQLAQMQQITGSGNRTMDTPRDDVNISARSEDEGSSTEEEMLMSKLREKRMRRSMRQQQRMQQHSPTFRPHPLQDVLMGGSPPSPRTLDWYRQEQMQSKSRNRSEHNEDELYNAL